MGTREQTDFGADLTEFIKLAAVGADTLLEDPVCARFPRSTLPNVPLILRGAAPGATGNLTAMAAVSSTVTCLTAAWRVSLSAMVRAAVSFALAALTRHLELVGGGTACDS